MIKDESLLNALYFTFLIFKANSHNKHTQLNLLIQEMDIRYQRRLLDRIIFNILYTIVKDKNIINRHIFF